MSNFLCGEFNKLIAVFRLDQHCGVAVVVVIHHPLPTSSQFLLSFPLYQLCMCVIVTDVLLMLVVVAVMGGMCMSVSL